MCGGETMFCFAPQSRNWCTILAIAAGAAVALVFGPPADAAVFGVDSRAKLPKRLEPLRQSIGLIYNERSRTVCSAFCVADDVIGTASHCLFRTKGEAPPPPEKFFFARPGTRHASVRFAGASSKTAGQHILAGSTGISTKPPIEASRDWAFVRLQSPACRGHVLAIAPMTTPQIEAEAEAGRLYQAAFHRDYGRWTMAYSEPCSAGQGVDGSRAQVTDRDFADPLNLVLHLCDTGGASSGSPLLIDTPAGPRVAAINVGTFVQSRVVIQGSEVLHRMPAAPVANTAVSSAAFGAKLELLRGAGILTSAADMRALQRNLTALSLFEGSANGRFDKGLRTAIESFETSAGLPVTGLPTRSLLEALQRDAATR